MRKLQHRRYSPACDLTVFFILQAIFSVIKKMPAIFSAVKKLTAFSFYRHVFLWQFLFFHIRKSKVCITVKKMPVK